MSLNAAMDNSIVSGKVGGNVGTAVSQEATSVRLSSVDRLSELLPDVRHLGLRRDGCPDLIKQDVEDLEAEVMHGAAQTLKRCGRGSRWRHNAREIACAGVSGPLGPS